MFRAALESVPPLDRDAWLDAVLGIDGVPDDGPELPRGCVPYMPCPVDALLQTASLADIGPGDVFVDVGSGLGRAALAMHLLTGASAMGVEVQPALAAASRALAGRLGVTSSLTIEEGDVAHLTAPLQSGSVFFLYCPFGAQRLLGLLHALEPLGRSRPLRICTVDLPLPPLPWLAPPESAGSVLVCRSAP